MSLRLVHAPETERYRSRLRLVRAPVAISLPPERPMLRITPRWREDVSFFLLSYVSGLVIFFGMIA